MYRYVGPLYRGQDFSFSAAPFGPSYHVRPVAGAIALKQAKCAVMTCFRHPVEVVWRESFRPEGFLVCADHIQGFQEWLRTEESVAATAKAGKGDDAGCRRHVRSCRPRHRLFTWSGCMRCRRLHRCSCP
ncbi:unnamed protein product [Ectocarpus sp. 12 AP-2014]